MLYFCLLTFFFSVVNIVLNLYLMLRKGENFPRLGIFRSIKHYNIARALKFAVAVFLQTSALLEMFSFFMLAMKWPLIMKHGIS